MRINSIFSKADLRRVLMFLISYSQLPRKAFRSSRLQHVAVLELDMADFIMPQTQYARSGDVSIAYQVTGDGPIDLLIVPGSISHLGPSW